MMCGAETETLKHRKNKRFTILIVIATSQPRCIFVIGGFISLVLMLLALRNNTFRMVSAPCMQQDAIDIH